MIKRIKADKPHLWKSDIAMAKRLKELTGFGNIA